MKVPGLSELVYDSEEQVQPLSGAVVSGQLPKWLSGSLYRVGPGKFNLDDNYRVNHWFDGLAMGVRFHIRDGGVNIQKRFIETDAYKKAMKHKKLIYTEFGSRGHPDPDGSIISRLIATILPSDMTDNCFNNIYTVNSQYFAVAETCLATRVDPNTLETQEKVDLSKHLGVNLCCSHPIKDSDGTVYTLGVSFLPRFKYQVSKIPPVIDAKDGKEALAKATTLVTTPSSWTTAYSFYHSFAVTEHFIVFFEQPLLLQVSKVLLMVVRGNSLKDCMEWHPEYKVKVHVTDKETGKMVKTKYLIDVAFFANHIANAYEENDQIVLDVITYENPDVLNDYFLEKMDQGEVLGEPGRVTRIVIPLVKDMKGTPENTNMVTAADTSASAERRGDTIIIQPQFYTPHGVEFPTFNLAYRGKPYRYMYATGLWDQGAFRTAVGRLDLAKGEWQLWRGEDATFSSEATFVARPGSSGEDDGVLLLTLLGSGGRADQLVVLDARTMEPVARVQFSCRIPLMFHNTWVPQINATEGEGAEKLSRE